MIGRVRAVVDGLAEPMQVDEIARSGADAVVVAIAAGDEPPPAVPLEVASAIAARLPPFTWVLARGVPPGPLPDGFHGRVVEAPEPVTGPADVVRIDHDALVAAGAPPPARTVWVRPRPRGSATATRFDFTVLERIGRTARLLLEIPDGAAGVETAVRLARPYGIVLSEGVWFRPGIIDVDRLERALASLARVTKPPPM